MTYKEAIEDIIKRAKYTDMITKGVFTSSSKNKKIGRSTLQENKLPTDEIKQGNITQIRIPANTVFNLLNLIEISSPSGISLNLNLLSGGLSAGSAYSLLQNILNYVKMPGNIISITKK